MTRKPKRKIRGKNTRWDDSFYLRCYLLARQGLTNRDICSLMKISRLTFAGWIKKRPALKEALEKARDEKQKDSDFKDYVAGRLPEHLLVLWEEIMEVEDGNEEAKKYALLGQHGVRTRQYLFLHAYVKTNFNKTKAFQITGISSHELTHWMKDKDFEEIVQHMVEAKKDFVEGALMDLVEQGEKTAVIFANKSLNSDRGYGQKIQVEHSGKLEHQHQHLIDIDKLQLPLEVRMIILEAAQKLEQKELGLLEDNSNTIEAEFVEKSA